MCYPIDPREVHEYLQELGYENISATQLRDFIKDLKKLIKHDERKKKANRGKENLRPEPKRQVDVFDNLYNNQTEATKAKIVVPKRDKVITVEVKQHKETCRHYKPHEIPKPKIETTSETKAAQVAVDNDLVKTSERSEGTRESDKPVGGSGDRKRSEGPGYELKPKSSFIRPKPLVRACRSDPVTLYHQYQAEWKKQKIPGEENHSNLRWVIREKMLGDQQSVPSTELIRKRSSSRGSQR